MQPLLYISQKPKTKSQLAYAGGNYQLYQGDSLALMGQLKGETLDVVFADPPYFLSNGGTTCRGGKRVSVDKGDWDASHGGQLDFTKSWLSEAQRLLKPSGTLWVTGTHHNIFELGFTLQQLGYHILNTVTWFKPNASPNLACRYFTHSTEFVIWASPRRGKGNLKHKFNYKAMKAENNNKQMRDVWAVDEVEPDNTGRVWSLPTPPPSEKTFGHHPTHKPLSLLRRIMKASTDAGDVVLDPFCGSGTTGVAALEHKCQFVGFDLNHDYLGLTAARLKNVETVH